MNTETVSIKKLKPNPANPRTIRDDKFHKLVQSVKDFPQMLEIRPIVVNDQYEVLGGNMRLRACIEAGMKEVTIIRASELTEDQQREFIIKDNVGFGEWDMDALANEWDAEELQEWGVDLQVYGGEDGQPGESENNYSKKIEAPIYEPKNEKPDYLSLFDQERTNELIQEIQSANIPQQEKDFLTIAAYRHTVFNYERIADFYAHSSPEVQKLMEDSALVIIDFQRAIELGYVKLSEEISKLYDEEYPDAE
jgi:ParB-like chromosome segregation protein Spo0J